MSLTTDLQAVAVSVIDSLIPTNNATWYSIANAVPADGSKPYIVPNPTTNSIGVRIVFYPEDREDRRFQTPVDENDLTTGVVLGVMYKTTFEPQLKDMVKWEDKILTVENIEEYRPVDNVIAYKIRFNF